MILAIIKPNAVKSGYIGKIMKMLQYYQFEVVQMKIVDITKEEAIDLYECDTKPYLLNGLAEFMSSGKSIVMTLDGKCEDPDFLSLIKKEIRSKVKSYRNVYRNAIHLSDSWKEGSREAAIFFKGKGVDNGLYRQIPYNDQR